MIVQYTTFACLLLAILTSSVQAEGVFKGQLIFPLEDWHNHGSCIVECPNGDMLVCWFHGSGEREADDVEILGARWSRRRASGPSRFRWPTRPGFPTPTAA